MMKKVKLYKAFITEANRGKVHKAAKKGSYPAVIVVVQDGKVIHQEPVSTPDVAPATFNVMQEKYPKALLHLEDKTGKRLFSESIVTEGKIKYAKGTTYQSSGHWTVYVDSNSSGFDIRVNHSAGWRLDPQDPREETIQLLDNGRQRATLMFKSGNIDKFAQNMFDLNDRTSNGNQTKLTAKDYADIIRVWIDMKKANESVVTEAKNTIGLAFKEEQDYLDFKEFVAEQPRGAIRKNIGFDSKTKSWEVIMDIKVLDSIYGEGTPGNKESGWYGALPGDFESVIIESVVTEARFNYKETGLSGQNLKDVKDGITGIKNALKRGNESAVISNYDLVQQRLQQYGGPKASEFLEKIKQLAGMDESVVTEAKKYKFKDLAKAWEFVYGEEMEDEYEGFYQEVTGKYKNKVTKEDIAKIWDEVYGEDIATEYEGFFSSIKEAVVTESKEMKFTDFLEILDKKFTDAMSAVKGENGSDAAIKPTRGDILQNFTLFRNYVSSLTKKYKGDKTKLTFLTEKVSEYELAINESVVTESVFSFKTDNVEQLHFETDPKTAELMKIELGKSQGEVSKRKQIESGEYSLRRFRKEIKFGDGTYLGVFIPGSYDAATSILGDGPHAKAVKKIKWTQKKYDQWLEDMAANGGAENAFDMAQNAKNEPGLIDWIKKEFRGDDALQRIQWDIEAFAESVVTESKFANKDEVTVKQLADLKRDIAKINKNIKVYISTHPVTKGELSIELGADHDNDNEIDQINSLLKKHTGDHKTGSMFSEAVITESEASSALLAFMDDEIKDGNDAQVHIATFSGNSMEAQSTKKTWDDGVPVTKNFTRGGYKTIAPKGKIWILESERFWYFQDKGIWYAVKIADYGTPPFEY